MEKWKPIPNYSLYHCSNTGLIKTFNWKGSGQTRIMKPALDACGYMRTMLKRDDGVIHTIKVHRIIAATWIENVDGKDCVNHKNGVKSDNSAENLEWCTVQENNAHAISSGLVYILKGEEIGNSKLTEKEVLEIRQKFIPFIVKRRHLAKEYNVSEAAIKDVLSRRTWTYL
jgi:hypothetical protein